MTDRNIDRKTEKTERLRQIQKHIYRGRDRNDYYNDNDDDNYNDDDYDDNDDNYDIIN